MTTKNTNGEQKPITTKTVKKETKPRMYKKSTETVTAPIEEVKASTELPVIKKAEVAVNKETVSYTFELPTRGECYDDTIPSSVTLRPMTAKDEMRRLAQTGLEMVISLINNCVVNAPEGFDAGNLKTFDSDYLLYKIRSISYGNIYNIAYRCNHCGEVFNTTVDLDALTSNYAPDNFTSVFDLPPLPDSGDILTCKALSSKENLDLDLQAQEILRKIPDYVGDPKYLLKFTYLVTKVNGKRLDPFQRDVTYDKSYFSSMTAKDSMFLTDKYNELTVDIGVDPRNVQTCPHCGVESWYVMYMTSEFFRPSF